MQGFRQIIKEMPKQPASNHQRDGEPMDDFGIAPYRSSEFRTCTTRSC
jgi:hypothetical protein